MSSPAAALPATTSTSTSGSSSGGNTGAEVGRWYFAKEKLETTPSRRNGIDAFKELTYRQQSALLIQDIGQRLQVNQLCINTAIVYMHRFYMFHSFTHFHRNAISAASMFLAAKVEEQPRKLEHVIKMAHYCIHRDRPSQLDTKSEQYLEQSAELVMNENILLVTLGFDVAVELPHTHVVKGCQLVRANKDLAQIAYLMATNSLHLTTMCLQYKPTVIACVCIYLACKWSSWEVPKSKEDKDWFNYVDSTVTTDVLEKLTTDFLQIFNKSTSRLKKKVIDLRDGSTGSSSSSSSTSNVPHHQADSNSGQHHHQSKSKSSSLSSPSPTVQASQRPSIGSQQSGVPVKPKSHEMPTKHRPKVSYAPGSSSSGHSLHNSSSHPPPHHSSRSSSVNPPPGKHPHSSRHPNQPRHPYKPHDHGQPSQGQYPQRGQPTQLSVSHSHHDMHSSSKPSSTRPASGSSSRPPSSTPMEIIQSRNPSKPVLPPHNIPPSTDFKLAPSYSSGAAVKNPSQPSFHSVHTKKPYHGQGHPELKRKGPSLGDVYHPQNHGKVHEKMMIGTDGMHSAPGTGSGSHKTTLYMHPRSMDSSSDRQGNMQFNAKRDIMSDDGSAATNGNNK